jgi:hypothetical protein
MASSGQFNTNSYGGRALRFAWSIKNQSIKNGYTTIQWALRSGGTTESLYMGTDFTVILDGDVVVDSQAKIALSDSSVIASGTKTLYHQPNGRRTFSVSMSGKINNTTCYGNASYTLDKLPVGATLLTVSEFNDENNPTITYTNYDGNDVSTLQVAIADADNKHIIYKNLDKTGSSYTFNFTEAERNLLRSLVKIRSMTTLTIHVITTTGTNGFYSSQNVVFTIKNGTPTLNPTVVDSGGVSTQLTGNPQTMIKHYNVMNFAINATARKGATITSVSVENGGSKQTTSTGKISYTSDNVFTFTATDSRGNTTTQKVFVPMVEYVPLTCSVVGEIALSDTDSTKSDITFHVSGNYFNKSFGAQENELTLTYKILDNSNTAVRTDSFEIDNNAMTEDSFTYSVGDEIKGLDYQNAYTIEVEAKDKIGTVIATSKSLRAVPVFDWGESDFNFNVDVKIKGTEIDYIVEQGESGGWYYRKWSSGFAECWYSGNAYVDVGEFYMDGFYYCGSKKINFPFTFKGVHYVSATGGSTSNMNIVRTFNYNLTDMTYIVLGQADISNALVRIDVEVKGRWKD